VLLGKVEVIYYHSASIAILLARMGPLTINKLFLDSVIDL